MYAASSILYYALSLTARLSRHAPLLELPPLHTAAPAPDEVKALILRTQGKACDAGFFAFCYTCSLAIPNQDTHRTKQLIASFSSLTGGWA
jgi:hypothetical protein